MALQIEAELPLNTMLSAATEPTSGGGTMVKLPAAALRSPLGFSTTKL
jgi:hypothetical protein